MSREPFFHCCLVAVCCCCCIRCKVLLIVPLVSLYDTLCPFMILKRFKTVSLVSPATVIGEMGFAAAESLDKHGNMFT